MAQVVSDGLSIFDELIVHAAAGWNHAVAGRIEEARDAYRLADDLLPAGAMNPELSVLRHNVGRGAGHVVPIPPTEDSVVSLVLPEITIESPDAIGMRESVIDAERLQRGVSKLIATFNPAYHAENIERHLPHVMVLSTGRCGTVSLYHLLANRGVEAYHTYWWQTAPGMRWEMACRLLDGGSFEGDRTGSIWAATRAAEWLGAVACGKPMLGLNHLDTIFAPVFAALHPLSRFVHLSRDPVAVFDSFVGKDQWGETQLRPLRYAFSPEFRFRRVEFEIASLMAWYIRFTETFARALGRVVGAGRYIEISADRLFAGDDEEIERLTGFIGASVSIDEVRDHFRTKINEKAHKAGVSSEEMEGPRRAFLEAYHAT